jgi:uncharacterized membrane protein
MKLNKALKPTISKLLLVIPFSIVMSLLGIALGSGFVDGWFIKWLKGLLIIIPIGYLCALIFLPFSQTIISKIKWN